MNTDLPNDIDSLKEIIFNLNNKNQSLEKQNQSLVELVALLKRKRFGASSEKVSHEQLGMFNEVETEDIAQIEDDSITVPSHKRAKRGKRLKLPEHLPRTEIVIDLDNKTCPEDGQELKCIGEDVSEELKIIPAKIEVIRTIRKKYSCLSCESMQVPAAPIKLLPKTNSSASLLAYIAVSKYCDALPLYRQEAMFKRIGMDLPRQTMARWMIKVSEKIEPIISLLNLELLKSNYIHMDETTVQVLKEDGKKAQTKSYMWATARSGTGPIILFNYGKNRSSDYPIQILGNYNQALQVDGYDGYQKVINQNNITRLGCWAHARRKFYDAFKSSSGKGTGKQALVFIKKLYKIEKEIKDSENRFLLRLKRSVPILLEFKIWLEKRKSELTPSSLAGKAVNYTLNEWEYLANTFTDSDFEVDNNYIESHIRPFTIGRKNWMFSVSSKGATASASLYSLIETAKANRIDPFEYLNNLFEKLPLAKSKDELRKLLPLRLSNTG
jgi:transposase